MPQEFAFPSSDPLVSTDWLAANLGRPGLVVLDASYFLPAHGRDAATEFAQARIPGSRRFDIDAVARDDTDLPHMLPDAPAFAAAVGAMGIGNDAGIVVFDRPGVPSAARVWWSFRAYGHPAIRVLDGGFAKWLAGGNPVETGPMVAAIPTRFDATGPVGIVTAEAIRDGIGLPNGPLIVDARAPARFSGTDPEPRAGLRRGHIPGAINLPFALMLNPDFTWRAAKDIRAAFAKAGIGPQLQVTASCGSGITACVLALGAERAGLPQVQLYDGSWAEWGACDDLAITQVAPDQ